MDYGTLTDQQVIERALDGRESAFRELIGRYERPVYSLIYRLVRDRERAEDLSHRTGKVRMQIPPGTQSGKLFRLKGKGIQHLHGHGAGDQLVQVTVWIPTKLSADEKQLFTTLNEHESIRPPKGGKGFFNKMKETLGV